MRLSIREKWTLDLLRAEVQEFTASERWRISEKKVGTPIVATVNEQQNANEEKFGSILPGT